MPETRATRSVDLPLAEIWSFVEDFDNWAPLLQGYESHETHSDKESTWALTGDLGPFSKTVHLKVLITEWEVGKRVAFTLEGVDEQVSGEGAFDLHEDAPPPPPEPPPRSLWQRIVDWFMGRKPEPPALPGPATSHVVFTFAVNAGGPMGPMINPMLAPYAEAVAQGLLDAVAGRLEAREAA